MRKAVWVCISLVICVLAPASCGWAVEREIAGVRLGEQAMQLLDRPGYGQPDFIGPLGAISVAAQQAAAGVAAAPGRASTRSGPTGPSAGGGGGGRGRGGGMRGGGRRGGRAEAPGMGTTTALGLFPELSLTGGPGGMRGGGGRRGGGGMRGGGGRRGGGGMRGGGGGRGGGGRRGGQTVGAAPRGAAGGGRAVAGAGMFWYYKRPGGAVVVLSLDLEGEVTSITLTGMGPTPQGRTTRGIGLGNHYMEVIAQYGYPDQSSSGGTVMEMTYVDHGVRFTLDAMRVREIAIGAHIAAEAEVAPLAPESAPPPPAGMSIEELRGYL